jgi:hypothetical protein
MTDSEKGWIREQARNLLQAKFGDDHGIHVNLDAALRVDGETHLRFFYGSAFWDMSVAPDRVVIREQRAA